MYHIVYDRHKMFDRLEQIGGFTSREEAYEWASKNGYSNRIGFEILPTPITIGKFTGICKGSCLTVKVKGYELVKSPNLKESIYTYGIPNERGVLSLPRWNIVEGLYIYPGETVKLGRKGLITIYWDGSNVTVL